MPDRNAVDKISLIGGHPALDFVNSVEKRDAPDENNYLTSYDALVHWAKRVELLSAGDANRLRLSARREKAAAARVWKDLMQLRRTMHAVFLAVARHDVPPAPALHDLNKQVKRAYAHRRLHADRDHLHWVWDSASDDLKRVEQEIVQSAAELLTSDKIHRVRKCAHDPCDWLFLDSSRSGRRRWCSMGTCGNVAKLRRFRAKGRKLRKEAR
jgi:predicted RNA-binding Zn ribbon-like protein